VFHERARESGLELRKTLLALATGALGVYFFALTTEVSPHLTGRQVFIVFAAVVLMAFSSLTGLLSWYADAKKNYLFGAALTTKAQRRRGRLYRAKSRWSKYYTLFYWLQAVAFFMGSVTSTVYLIARLAEW